MPNHVHGIIIIDKTGANGDPVSPNQFGPQSQNLASVIRGYKIGVTKLAGGDARDCRDAKYCVSTGIWQPRYHDHIIRNAGEYGRIENYIINNPARWAEDRFCNHQNHDE
jgi:REP element-mobilizing transposase RayT